MKIYIMTDLEGVSGVLDNEGWCEPQSPYLSEARRLMAGEVNAAIDGFFSEGATTILVADGHGHGGFVREDIDPRVEVVQSFPEKHPYKLDASFDAVAWVGQHARSGAIHAHLAHTGDFSVIELSVNGHVIGEIGQFALCASELGVPAIFLAGDQAACDETKALIPDIDVVSVKRGTQSECGDEVSTEAYATWTSQATHEPVEKVRQHIRDGAGRALRRLRSQRTECWSLTPPYERRLKLRPSVTHPYKRLSVERHPSSIIDLMNLPYAPRQVE